MANSQLSIFTTAMRTEFITQYNAVAVPTPYEKFTGTIKSTARFENYDFMTVTPSFGRYMGKRRLGKIANTRYIVPNLEWDASFEVLLRDIQDDQTGGYLQKPKELAQKAKVLPNRIIFQALNQGNNYPCFDGTNYFATAHTYGSFGAAPAYFTSGSGNKFTFTAASGDSINHTMIVLITNDIMPAMWYQQRKEPEFMTDADSPFSRFTKTVKYWLDLESAPAYGYWWNAIRVDITNTPTLTELQNLFSAINTALRRFVLPTSTPSDLPEYVHANHEFNEKTTTVCVSPGLEILVRQVLHNEVIIQGGGPVTNVFNGWAGLVTSADLDPTVTTLDLGGPG